MPLKYEALYTKVVDETKTSELNKIKNVIG